MQTLENIIQQCKKGREKAQNELYQRFTTPMFRLCFRYLENEEEAEEVLVNGFLKVFQNLNRFDYQHEAGFIAWVKKIMCNEALMFIRKNKKLYWEDIEERVELESDEDTLQHLLAEDIYKLILELPLGYRTVFNLYVIEGYNHKEIGEKLNISNNTSKTQLKKARDFLKKKLAKNEMEYETARHR